MLSFQKEQGAGDPASKASHNGAQENEFVKVDSGGDSVRRTTILVAIIFTVGLLCLWFMIKKSVPESASAQTDTAKEARVDNAITQLTGLKTNVLNQMDSVLNKLYEFTDVEQVDVTELSKNPFEIEAFAPDITDYDVMDNMGVSAEAMHREQMKRDAALLELQSIIESSDQMRCMINGEILSVGDKIEEFQVCEIKRDSAVLSWLGSHSGDQTETEYKAVLTISE